MLIVIAVAIVWVSICALVWAACLAAARGDVERFAPCFPARTSRHAASEAGERLIIWESLPGLPVPDSRLGAEGAH